MEYPSAVLALSIALLTPAFTLAQTSVTCHARIFQAPAGSKVTNPLRPSGINRWGNVVGLEGAGKPFIRFTDGRVQLLSINIPSADLFDVGKRNASGVTVGTVQTLSPTRVSRAHGFANAGTTTVLIDIPNANTRVTGINRYGTIVGNFFSTSGTLGNGNFVLKNGTVKFLQVPAQFARNTETIAISDTGVIVGNYALVNSPPDPDQTTHGFVLINGKFQDLAFPSTANNTFITDINATGMIVGVMDGSDPRKTFIYKGGKFFVPKFVLPNGSVTAGDSFIWGVNGFGQITGQVTINARLQPFVGTCSF
jgi:hypothetical protein